MRLSHIAWNLGGLLLPLGVAVVTVPHLISRLGQERFGLLALAWGLIGYAGALDLGIGRALTQMVSKLRGEGNLVLIPDVLATAGRVTLVTGLVGGALITLATMLGAASLVNAHSTPPAEIQQAMLLLAIAFPVQAMSATYRGMNEAFLNFRGISLLRGSLGVINFAGPFCVALFTDRLPWLISTLVVSRLLALVVFRQLAFGCLSSDGKRRPSAVYSADIARRLFSFGGWVTISSIVSPILVQADRFVIAAVLSAAAVTVYVLPYEVVVQSLVLVGAISSVMFPGLSKLIQEKPGQWRPYFLKWLFRVAGMMTLVCSTMFFVIPVLLPMWIKHNLHPESIEIGRILCLGVMANAVGAMFYSLIHARGRAVTTAIIHLIELPIFVCALFLLTREFGIVGAAWAWVGRMIFDAIALGLCARTHRG